MLQVANTSSKIILEKLIPRLKELTEKHSIFFRIFTNFYRFDKSYNILVIPKDEHLPEGILSYEYYDYFSSYFEKYPSFKKKYPHLYKILNLGKDSMYTKKIRSQPVKILPDFVYGSFTIKTSNELAQNILSQLKKQNQRKAKNINIMKMTSSLRQQRFFTIYCITISRKDKKQIILK